METSHKNRPKVVRVPVDVHHTAKAVAASQGLTLMDFVGRALRSAAADPGSFPLPKVRL